MLVATGHAQEWGTTLNLKKNRSPGFLSVFPSVGKLSAPLSLSREAMGTGLGSAAVAAPSTGGPGGKRREYLVGFAVSSASPALAAVATNPIEVVKVRQQMQDTECMSRKTNPVGPTCAQVYP